MLREEKKKFASASVGLHEGRSLSLSYRYIHLRIERETDDIVQRIRERSMRACTGGLSVCLYTGVDRYGKMGG